MCSASRGTENLLMIMMLLPLLIIPHHTFGGEDEKKPEAKSESKADFVLKIEENLISLKANDASLKEILEEIGRRMEIEVDAQINIHEKVTTEFTNLTVEDAMERLSTNYMYLIDSEKKGGKIMKIVLLPRGEGTAISTPTTKKSMVEEGKSMVKPEIRARERSPQPVHEETEKEKPSKPKPFKFEFDPSEFMKEGK